MVATAIDLFCGCGGLSVGLEKAGFKVIAAAEVLEHVKKAYLLNHKATRVYGDVRQITIQDILTKIEIEEFSLDLLAGCPPCQGFSSIRTRNRDVACDERNELIFEVERLVRGLKPKCVLLENVPRLLSDWRLNKFEKSLVELGYQCSKGVVDAQYYGVPQRRRRMIFIASRIGKIEIAPPTHDGVTVRSAIGSLPSPDSGHAIRLHGLRQRLSPIVLERISNISRSRSELPEHLVLPCHRKYPQGFRDVYGRMEWDKVAPTITRASHNPSKGRFVHPSENRGITLYEALLLQGFPKNYKFPENLGIGKISSMIGEAVPPPLAEAQARHILQKINEFYTNS